MLATSLPPEQTDILIKTVNDQMAEGNFDTSNSDTLEQLVAAMGDTRGMVRLRIAQTLGDIGPPALPHLLEALAHHPNPVVRRASAKTITLIGAPEAIPTLVNSLLQDEDTVVKGSCAGALAAIGGAAVPVLLDILQAPGHSESIKGHAAWGLAFIGGAAKEYLYKAWASESEEVRMAVLGAIAKVSQEETQEELIQNAYPILIEGLHDPAESVRCEAATAISNLGCTQAIPHLVQLLQQGEGESRKAAALALMKMGDTSVVGSLEQVLPQETSEGIKKVISLAIDRLKAKNP